MLTFNIDMKPQHVCVFFRSRRGRYQQTQTNCNSHYPQLLAVVLSGKHSSSSRQQRLTPRSVGPASDACRLILGMMNGITPAIRTTVHEVCGGSRHGVQAMAYIDGETAPSVHLKNSSEG